MKGWTPKEREEAKRHNVRLTGQYRSLETFHRLISRLGRQLFERGPQALILEDAALVEEGTESVDITMFDRTERGREEEEARKIGS